VVTADVGDELRRWWGSQHLQPCPPQCTPPSAQDRQSRCALACGGGRFI